MVKTRSERPSLRPKGASPERGDRPQTGRVKPLPEDGPSTRTYPNMEAREEFDRQEHIRRGREMGLTQRQAKAHANEEVHQE